MNGRRTARSMTGTLACVAALLATTPNAYADANLTLTPVSTQCAFYRSVFDPFSRTDIVTRGSSSCAPSPTSPFDVTYFPGTSGLAYSFIEATYAFTYRDDGLALTAPAILDTGDYVRGGSGLPPSVSFESATLAVDVTTGLGPNQRRGYDISATTIDVPAGATSIVDGYLMFGLNDHADDFSGTLTVRIGVYASLGLASVTGVAVSPSIAAIPEPSTYALMAVGLAAVGASARRRRRGDVALDGTSQGQATA